MVLVATLTVLAGIVVWQKEKKQKNIQDQVTEQQSEIQSQGNTRNETQTESEQAFSPQHIVAIPSSQQVWYEVPEMGIKLLLSKEVAGELVYRYSVNDAMVTENDVEIGNRRRTESIIFSVKSILKYNETCSNSPGCGFVDESYRFAVSKIPGSFHKEELILGSKLLKQFNDFYLITGASPQASPFNSQEEAEWFKENIISTMPQIPALVDIKIELIQR